MAINSLSAASKGFSGMVSGMNSQEMVQQMLAGTQMKIDKAGQKKVTLQNKQAMYREVSSKLKTLQSGFLSFTSNTNLLSNAFYNNMSATVNPPSGLSAAFSVKASSNAKPGTVTVNKVEQLAKAYSKETKWKASGAAAGELGVGAAGNLWSKYSGADATMKVTVGGVSVDILNAPLEFENLTASQVADKLNTTIFAGGALAGAAQARVINNKLVVEATDPSHSIEFRGNTSVSATNKSLATQMFGTGMAVISGKDGLFTAAVDTSLYQPSFEMDLDGNKQTIRVGLSELQAFSATPNATTGAALVASINANLTKAYGTGVQASYAGGNIEFAPGNASQTFTVTGNPVMMGTLGMKAGASNKLNGNLSLKDLNFDTPLQGGRHVFNINGVEFSYNADVSLNTVINDVNKSAAGVRLTYNGIRDTFKIESKETGTTLSPTPITYSQTEGNILSAFFGEAGTGNVTTTHVTKDLIAGTPATSLGQEEYGWGGTYTFNVNGVDVRIGIPAKADAKPYSLNQFANKMNTAFRQTFGTLSDGTQANEFLYDGSNFSIVTNSNAIFKILESDPTASPVTNRSKLGFTTGESSLAKATDTLDDLGINLGATGNIQFSVDGGPLTNVPVAGTDTMATVAANIEAALGAGVGTVVFDTVTGGFKIINGTATTIEIAVNPSGAGIENAEKLFGGNKVVVGALATNGAGYTEVQGQNAKVTINGTDVIERASNSFEYEGLTFTLHRTTEITSVPGTYEPNTLVTTERNTDEIIEGIQEFLKLYNETIDYINELVKEDATYKEYAPLLSSQKAAMSENEIEVWEKKSKEGLLRNDANLISILDKMRKALYTKPDGSAIALYNMGIDTSFYANDGNFKEKSAGDIKAYFERNPDAVRNLFAGEGGIMGLLDTAINGAVSSSYSTPGSLVQVAGSSGLDTQSSIYKQIKNVDEQLVRLENRYWSEYNRYWKQFNTMEKIMQQSNAQSSWLAQQFGG